MIKIVEHETSVETKVMAFDHDPYSTNTTGVPAEIADAARAGFALYLSDIDCRAIEWRELEKCST